tara:strand:+ start:7931 stop:10045 length:2115 start_codon:yes stop_codon:yes gene_type:complete
MAKRKYTKKSEYWKQFEASDSLESLANASIEDMNGTEPILAGDPYYTQTSKASRTGADRNAVSRTGTRMNSAFASPKIWKYANIREGMLPYYYTKLGADVRDAIMLCQKAYANIPIFRNVIDIMSEFANTELYIEGGTEKSRNFIDKWFQKVKIWNLKDQFFREYYRSGNVFLYRVDSKFTTEDFNRMSTIYGSEFMKPGQIPIKYILLNPYDIATIRSTNFQGQVYRKILSEFELERLQDPKTEYDKEVLEGLPKKTQDLIKSGGYGYDGIYMELDPDKLNFSFYKKQDYEPFAIPFGFPVLDDLNWKMELKKIDQSITRTIENVILLITMGNTPDKGGINPNNLKAMQTLFSNESIGRVLVSDYTTKAEFIIPDLNKVLGPEKYEIVDKDIKEALQNVVVGHERYSNTQVKAQIFLERLKEARDAFLNDFLVPQVKLVCQNLGFRKYPTIKFQEIDLKDEVQLQRVTTRLMELGILTPEQGVQTIKTGLYPETHDLVTKQEAYIEERQKGFYTPLVGGQPLMPDMDDEGDKGQPSNTNQPEDKTPTVQDVVDDERIEPGAGPVTIGRPRKVKQERGRPSGSNKRDKMKLTTKAVQDVVYEIENLFTFAQKEMKSSHNIKRLSKDKKTLLDELCKTIVISTPKKDWESKASSCIKDFSAIEGLGPMPEVLEASQEHQLEIYPAALVYHAQEKDSQSTKDGVKK